MAMDQISCYFDISIDCKHIGRIKFSLFSEDCPKTCENFRCLCTGERGTSKQFGKPLHYKGSQFHRVVKNFIIQGGDIVDNNGKGGDSIYDGSFKDENLSLKHDRPYLLSMANRGPDTNRSQFFITTSKAPHLDGKHVVFGKVVSGHEIVDKIERLEVNSKSRPIKTVVIESCGQLSSDSSLPYQYRTANNERRKRKLSTSSRSSNDTRIIRRHRRKSRSVSRSSSSGSSSTSRSGSSCSSISHSRSSPTHSSSSDSSSLTPSPRRKRRYQSCSSSQSPHGHYDSPSSAESSSDRHKRRARSKTRVVRSGSSGSCRSISSNNSKHESSQRKNRRIKTSRKLEESQTGRKSPGKIEPAVDSMDNPHYKCSVRLDEIPEVPVNRFLMREPLRPPDASSSGVRQSSRRPDITKDRSSERLVPIDLSQFQDLPEGSEAAGGQMRAIKSQVKPTEPLVSKSGRIMRGRGTFKFCTPSPENSPHRDYREKRSHHDSSRDRHRSRSRWSRSRSRSRGRSPPYRYSSSRRTADRVRNQLSSRRY